jgi:hypothetical protein
LFACCFVQIGEQIGGDSVHFGRIKGIRDPRRPFFYFIKLRKTL